MADTFVKKAKDMSQEEINSLCSNLEELIISPEKSADCCGLMRQLFIILQASEPGAQPCVPHSLVRCLTQFASSSSRQKTSAAGTDKFLLSHMLLSELLPEVSEDDQKDLDLEEGNHNLSAVYMLQGINPKCLNKNMQHAIRWLQLQDFDKQKAGMAFVTAATLAHGEVMSVDSATRISEILSQWLSSASVRQAANPHTLNPFRKDEELTEIDGTSNTNMFTALNIGQFYTDDQLMNIYSFSVLYKWLLALAQTFTSAGSSRSSVSGAETLENENLDLSLVRTILELLAPKAVDICLRVIDQCERKAKSQSDVELQVACLVEATQVLDMICSLDKNQAARVFKEVKRLNARLTQATLHLPVMVYILRFLFNHSTAVVHDPQETFQHFFTTVISTHFKEQGIMYDIVDFLLNNLAKIAETTSILTDYFPDLFKILAWHPRTFLCEFAAILPAVMNPDTSIEVFHLLLDLPCMTAALEVIERAKKTEPITVELDSEPASSLEAFYNPRFRPLFSYITRCESGQGDTIDRLSRLHSILRDCMGSTRVMVCCQLVPVLLNTWFEAVMVCEDPAFIAQLLPVVTERSGLMFGVPELIEDVQKIFADKLLVLCRRYPEIITRQLPELCEFVQTTANMAGRVTIYSNLIFAVGEYSSQSYCPDCTSEMVGKYYESLEVVTYELLNHLGSQNFDASIPKVLSTLISSLSKLASRSQDLIPRAILCLTKVAKQQNLIMLNTFTKDFLTHKTASLIALLKNPESASLILDPNLEVGQGKCHLNNTSIASIMRGVHRLIKD